MIRNRTLRRSIGVSLAIAGGFLIWAPVSLATGVVLIALGLALEAVGMYLER